MLDCFYVCIYLMFSNTFSQVLVFDLILLIVIVRFYFAMQEHLQITEAAELKTIHVA